VPRLEEVVYDAARNALADQDAVVSGIRQRTGTLLAAHALVASFLGATAVKASGLHGFFGWGAVAALVSGLVIAAVLLSNWRLRFAIDAPQLYQELYDQADAEAAADTLGWLVAAGYGYQELRAANAGRVKVMGLLLTVLGVLMIAQTLLWLGALQTGRTPAANSSSCSHSVTPRPISKQCSNSSTRASRINRRCRHVQPHLTRSGLRRSQSAFKKAAEGACLQHPHHPRRRANARAKRGKR
jgi:hypothetical protein